MDVTASKETAHRQRLLGRFLHRCLPATSEFLTPCTHKQDGTYALFPTPELIVRTQ